MMHVASTRRGPQIREALHPEQRGRSTTREDALKPATHEDALKPATHEDALKPATHEDALKAATHEGALKPARSRERASELVENHSTPQAPCAPLSEHPALTRRRGPSELPFYLVRAEAPEPRGGKNSEGFLRDEPSTAPVDAYEPKGRLCGVLPPAPPVGVGRQYRIDPDRVLTIVRDAVRDFPELLIRVDGPHFARLEPDEQMRWAGHMDMIRLGQRRSIIQALRAEYGEFIDPSPKTFVYHGGGTHCYLEVLYCSENPFDGEYLAFCWAPWRLDGMANYYSKAVVWDYIMEGENLNHASEPRFGLSRFENVPAGEYTFLPAGQNKRWIADTTSMLDHGRGNIASMMPRAYLPNLTHYLDFKALNVALGAQIRTVLRSLSLRFRPGARGTIEPTPEQPHGMEAEEYRTRMEEARAYFRPILAELEASARP